MRTEENTDISAEYHKVVVFKLGTEEFGVDIGQVNRIIKMGTITRIPNTPSYILGVLNLRGGIIVVVDLAQKLGFPSKEFNKKTRIIDIEINNTIVGMIVDSATELLKIDSNNIRPAPDIIQKKINGDYLTGVAILENRILIILDLTKVLNTDEIAHVNMAQDQGRTIRPSSPQKKREHPILQHTKKQIEKPPESNLLETNKIVAEEQQDEIPEPVEKEMMQAPEEQDKAVSTQHVSNPPHHEPNIRGQMHQIHH